MLATVSMALSVGLVAGFAHWVLGMSLGAAVLLGAIAAPTDPVLATEVQPRHSEDRDRLRFTLTCEAGMNDGTAFPFIMLGLGLLGLHDLGDGGQRWLLVDLDWATLSAIALGVLAGWGLAQIGARMRGPRSDPGLLDDFLALGLIGVVYGICLWISAWGFLAVFFAAVALRQTEQRLAAAASTVSMEDAADASERQHVSVPYAYPAGQDRPARWTRPRDGPSWRGFPAAAGASRARRAHEHAPYYLTPRHTSIEILIPCSPLPELRSRV